MLNTIKLESDENQRVKKHNHYFRFKTIVAVASAVLIIGLGFTFAIRPALAADIPVISDVVYRLAPVNTPDAGMKDSIEKNAQSTLNGFFSTSLDMGQSFKFSDDWVLDDNTLLAAYYLKYLGATSGILNGGKEPSAANIHITDIDASAKAYRIYADVRFDLMLDGQKSRTESVHLEMENKIKGLVVTGMSMDSSDFQAYKTLIMEYKNADKDKPLCNEIAKYNAFLYGQATVDNKKKVSEEKQLSTREEKIENIAAELMYQYWLTQKTCIMSDIAALIERNDDTELFFLAMELQTKMAGTGFLSKKVIVEKGYGEVKEISEKDGLFNVHVYVKTIIDGSTGEDLILLLKPKDDSFIVVGYDKIGEGVYYSLKTVSKKLMDRGISRREAYQKAYQTRVNEVETVTRMINEKMELGLTQEDARQEAYSEWLQQRE